MIQPAAPESGTRRTPSAVWTWVVAVVLWLYYLTPILVPGRAPSLPLILVSILPGLGGFLLLALRRRHPVLVPILLGCLLLIGPGPAGAAFAAMAHLARVRRSVATVVLVGGWILGTKLVSLIIGPHAGSWQNANTVELTVMLAGLVIAVLVGALGGSRATELRERAIADQAVREAQQARLDHARLAERERIAREMHDVLAHRLTLVAMHAGALAYRNDLDQQTARETADLIQRNAKLSLAELRAVLSDLRGVDQNPEPPQPTLAELDTLISEASQHQRLDAEITLDPSIVAQRLSRDAYRIIQEALTNARKHAPGAPVRLQVSGQRGEELVIRVSNPVTPLALADGGGSGLGLVGIAERVDLAGGTVRHGVDADRFEVEARMPWQDPA